MTVSSDTVYRITSLLLRGDGMTRRQLAEAAGVSVMTAGKIVDVYREAGLLEEFTETADRGRSPRGLRMSCGSVAWGILRVEEKGCSLTLLRSDGELLESHSLLYDSAMSPEENEKMLRGRWHLLKDRIEKQFAVTGIGLILRGMDNSYWNQALRDGIGAEAERIEWDPELTAERLCEGSLGRTVLYLRLDREIETVLAVGTEWTAGISQAKGQQRYETLADQISELCALLDLEGIVAESHGRYAGDAGRFLHRLESEWSARSKKALPKLHMPEKITLAEQAMLAHLNDALATELARTVGK